MAFVPSTDHALYFSGGGSGKIIETVHLDLEVSFGNMKDGNMNILIPAVSSGISLNQWSKIQIFVVNNIYTVKVNRYESSISTTRHYRRPLRNDLLTVRFGQDPEQMLKSKPFTADGPFDTNIAPMKSTFFLGSTGLFSDFKLSFSIWTSASKIYSKEIIRFSDGRSKSPVVNFDINGNLNIIISENEQIFTKEFISFKSTDHRIFESEGWKKILIDVDHDELKASVKDIDDNYLMPPRTITLQNNYRPYKNDGKVYIKSNFLEEDANVGIWIKILQIDGAQYTPDINAMNSGTNELSDNEGFRKMSDEDINNIEADSMGYNYYMFIDDKSVEELVLYVRTKEDFQDTATSFGWMGSNPTALYDFCFLDHLQSITECTWTNRYFGRFGTGVGRACNQWQFDDNAGPKCIHSDASNNRCFSYGGDQTACPFQTENNQLRENVKIYKSLGYINYLSCLKYVARL